MNNANDASGLNTEIANSVAKVYGWKGFNVPEERSTIQLNPDLLASYAGTYARGTDSLTLERRPEGLFFSDSPSYYGRPQAVTFVSPDQFYVYEEESFTDFWGYNNRYFVSRHANRLVTAIIRRVKGEPDTVFTRR